MVSIRQVNDTDAAVDATLALLDERPATLGAQRLVCIDGPAGSGKTTLAAAVCARLAAPVVHMDDLYPGWSGMDAAGPEVQSILDPLARGEAGSYRRFDWVADRYAEQVTVPPAPVLVLEGVDAGDRAWAEHCTVLVWVETDAATRLRRGLNRDGDRMRAHWEAWMAEEETLFARERTRERADVEVRT